MPAALDAWLAESAEAGGRHAARGTGPETKVWPGPAIGTRGVCRARRMAHEIAVHRADATLAAGLDVRGRSVASPRTRSTNGWTSSRTCSEERSPRMTRRGLRGAGSSIHLHATDAARADAEWVVELDRARASSGGATTRRRPSRCAGRCPEVMLAFYQPTRAGQRPEIGGPRGAGATGVLAAEGVVRLTAARWPAP